MTSCKHGRVRLLTTSCLIITFFILVVIKYRVPFSLAHSTLGQGVCNSTLGFEAILSINAPWRTDRKDALTLAAAHSGLSLEWIGGINASHIDERAYPQGNHRALSKTSRGAWRAHMNAIRTVIENNLSTALIMEDDVDWDPRIRGQLHAFGRASHRLPDMIERADLAARNDVSSRDHTTPQRSDQDPMDLASQSTLLLPAASYTLSSNPYGETADWDILWLGHCNTSLPPPRNSSASNVPPHRIILLADDTVSDTDPSQIPVHPPRTRIYHRTYATRCIPAYAVTQRGARKIMYEHGIRNFDKEYDSALSEWCDGLTKHMGDRPMCLTSSPSIFGSFGLHGDRNETDKEDAVGEKRKQGSLTTSIRESLNEGFDGGDL